MTTTAERLRTFWGERQFDRERWTALAVRYWEVAIFGALISLALGLRLWGLGERAIHHDESLHMFYAWQLFKGDGYEHIPFMHGPFQFFGSAVVFRLFGDSDYTARLLYALVGSALVGAPYFLRNYIGRTGALVAAALIALSPTLLYFSRFARGDIYMVAWTMAMVIILWRYLKEQKEAYLYGVPLFLVLGFLTKEVTFITAAIFLIYLEFQLATDFVDQLRASRSLTPAQVVLAYAVLLPTAWLIAIAWPLIASQRRRWSLSTLPPAAHLLIIMATFAMPQFAPAIQKIPFLSLGNVDVFDDPGEDNLRIITTLALLILSAYVGLLWNWRVWSIGAVIFYVPYVLLYTTFFTNLGGFWTGIWGSLDYWLSQQLERRGNQPDYYYFMTVSVYEFLPLIFALGGALYYAFRGKIDQIVLSAAALVLVLIFSLLPGEAPLIDDYWKVSFLIAIGAVLLLQMETFTKFLLFWTLSILFGLTVAGEKMPWLTAHIALPMALLAAKVMDDVLSTLGRAAPAPAPAAEPRAARRRARREEPEEVVAVPGVALDQLLALAGGAGLAVIAALIFQAAGPGSGVSVIAWLLSLAAAGVIVWLARTGAWRMAGQVAAVALFGALLVFTVRAGTIAAFDQGDPNGYPREALIYAQGSPSLGVLRDDIERLAQDSGQGRNLKVILDNSVNTWPWPWYLRNRTYELNNFDSIFDPPPGSVVLVSVQNQAKMEPFLDRYRQGIPYTHMWWFPEFYRGLEPDDFLGRVFDGHYFSTWRAYFIDRIVPGASSAPDILAYFPINFEPVVPDTPGGPVSADPLPEGSYTIIGGVGGEPGQFSQPADMAVDAQGNLYVVDTLNHRIQKIAPDGTAQTFGGQGSDEGQFGNPRSPQYDISDGPWGVAVDAAGNIYAADTWNHRVQKFGPDLQFLLEWGTGDFFGPRDIAVNANGNVLVVDTGNKRVRRYDAEGRLIDERGAPGDGPGEFNEPSSISIAQNGDIYVADYWNRRIQRFNAAFEYIDEIEVGSWGSQGVTDRAYIAALADGRVLASDPANSRIIVFSPAGDEEASWRLPSSVGASRPVGIAVDAQGQVYISDGIASQIVKVAMTVLLPTPP